MEKSNSGGRASSKREQCLFAWTHHKLILVLGAFGLVASGPSLAQVAVTETGTPAYSMSISVPPGISGMSPNIGLSYASSGVNGPVGYGWSIQGVSLITRCPQTRAIDGVPRGVTYSTDDKLCLDGQRLIQTDAAGVVINGGMTSPGPGKPFQSGDSLGGDGLVREFRTEKDTYVRVRAYGSNGVAANGPAYFKVWTKSGQIYEYGNNNNASANAAINVQGRAVVAAWAVSRISDTLGNYIDFQYEQRDVAWGSGPTSNPAPGHEWNLLEIRYTGTPTQVPANKVVFSYDDRPSGSGTAAPAQDRGEAYAQGAKNVSVRRINSIRTYVNSPNPTELGPAGSAVKVKTIKLTYDNGPITNRSRVKQLTECVGAAETACLPSSVFNYAPGGDSAYVPLAAFNQKVLPLLDATTGSVGILVGDFNGDGLTDFIRWSDTPAQNQLYLSQGNGEFSQVTNGTSQTQFNIIDVNLFKSTGSCYTSTAADFNGDGLTDVLRFSGCPSDPTYLYLNQGGGSFARTTVTVPLVSATSRITHDCLGGNPREFPTCAEDHPVIDRWSAGDTFYILDVNGDGFPDLITTTLPAGYKLQYATAPAIPDPCATSVCTHVYLGSGSGAFVEAPSNLANHSLYSPPRGYAPSMTFANADLDGDGLTDLTYVSTDYWEKNAGWVSRGDGNFDPATGGGIYCSYVLDFNGDGRSDCLSAVPSFPNYLAAGGAGLGYSLGPVGNFNLSSEVLVSSASSIVVLDLDGDGRADLLRWKDDPTQNAAFLSNGDGTFRAASNFNLNTTARALNGSNGLNSFVIGDFTGRGQPEILRMKSQPFGTDESTTNQLYVKVDSTPADLLSSVVSPTGLTTTLTWVPITNSSSGKLGVRYVSDRGVPGLAATYPKIDIAPPSYVVARSETATGVGDSTLATEYSYKGLKAAFDGRGALGFRETRRQSAAPDGSDLTVVTQYLQDQPYIGVPSSSQTYIGTLASAPANLLSRTTNIYCDKMANRGAEADALSTGSPCPMNAKVQRPYLLKTLEEGSDPVSHAPLPTVTTTNSFSSSLNPTNIVVTTTGVALGLTQTFTKITANAYLPDNTSGDSWILGRLQQATQTNTAPNSLAAIPTTAGTAPGATAIQGNGPTQSATLANLSFGNVTATSSSTLAGILTNSGALPLTITVPSSNWVSGTGFTVASTTCGTALAAYSSCAVSVTFTPVDGSSYAGSLAIATGAGTLTATLSGTGVIPSVVFQPSSTNWGVVGAASDSGDWPQIKNNSAVAVLIAAHSVASGPAGVWSWQGATGNCIPGTTVLQPGQSCPTFFGTSTLAAPGSYSAVDQIGYQVVGGNGTTLFAQQSYAFSIATTTANSSGIAFGNTMINTTSSTQSFVLTNNAVNGGSLKKLSISMTGNQPGNFPFSHNCGVALAQGASCTVTVAFNPTSVGNGISAAVLIQGSYARMQAGVDSGLTQYTGVNLSVSASGDGTEPPPPTLNANPAYFYGQTTTNTSPVGNFAISFSGTATGLKVTTTVGSIINNACTGSQTNTCSFGWTTPAGKSTVSGTITVTAANGANALAIPVSRTYGGEPDRAVATLASPTSQVIPPTWYGTGVSSVAVTYRNDGTLPLTLSSPLLSAPLSITSNGCSSIAPGASCSMTVSRATNIAGLNQGQTFTPPGADSGPGPTTLIWSVYSAIPRWGSTSMNMGTVGVGASTSQDITLFNDGNAAYNWASNSTIANLPIGYSFNTGSCSNVSPGGGNCAVTVTFTPPGVGTYSGSNLYPVGPSQAANSLTVTGVGGVPGLTLSSCSSGGSSTSPTPMQQTCVVGNTGTAASSVTYSTTLPGGSASGPSSCMGNTVDCGRVTVTSPPAAGTYAGTVTVTPSSGIAVTSGTLNFTVNSGSLTLSANPAYFYGQTTTNISPVGYFTISFSGTATGLNVTTTVGSIINNTCTGSQTGTCSFRWTTPAGKSTVSGTITVTATNGANALAIPVSRTYVF